MEGISEGRQRGIMGTKVQGIRNIIWVWLGWGGRMGRKGIQL